MANRQDSGEVPQGPQSSQEDVRASRRRLLRNGLLGAAPVLMSHASPTLAGTGFCFSVSMAGSANVSQKNQPIVCAGRSPGYWKVKPEQWVGYTPSGAAATKFSSVFSGCPTEVTSGCSTITFMQLLCPPYDTADNSGGELALARACIAALLNISSGKYPGLGLTVADVLGIWTGRNTGWQVRGGTLTWFRAESIVYLQSTYV